jgi:peroxiredoxin
MIKGQHVSMRNSSLRMPGLRRGWFAATVVAAMACLAAVNAAESPNNPEDAVIHLTNGDHVTGRLVDSPVGHSLTWQSPSFIAPFQFAIPSVNRVQFPSAATPNPPAADYRFELAGRGDLFGSLVGWRDDEVALDVLEFGRLHVDRAVLRRISRWRDPADRVYSGPNGLTGWQVVFNSAGWREESGQLVSDKGWATLRGDAGTPSLARIEFELSWRERPDFEFGVGGDFINTAFRFTIWENQLVIVRENDRGGDIAVLQTIAPGPGRIHLQAFLDQPNGHLLVFSSDGRPLADLTVVATKPRLSSEVQISKSGGDIRLERLTVDRWNGETPRAVAADESRFHFTDGTMIYGRLKSFDTARREFVIESQTTENRTDEQRIAESRVRDIVFGQDNSARARLVQAATLSGQRISGELLRVEQNTIWMKSPGIREELVIPVATLQSLTVLTPTDASPASKERIRLAFPTGRLELPGTVLHGSLVENEWSDIKSLVWKPSLSSHSSPLRHGVPARILYREPPPSRLPGLPPPTVQLVPVQGPGGVVFEAKVDVAGQNSMPPDATYPPVSKPGARPPKPVLYLRSGDRIPCEFATIDESGVTFATKHSDVTTIRHGQLRGLELLPGAPPVRVPQPKLGRLLMLPRMQKDNPPTHLIQSIDGDCLRGRLVSMDQEQLRVEIRLEIKTLHRDRVARIIWLRAAGVDDVSAAPLQTAPDLGSVTSDGTANGTGDGTANGTLVQAVLNGGNRLTFLSEQLAGPFLSGRGELLGECRVDLQQIDQLLVGPAIELAPAAPAFAEWTLKPPTEPAAAADGAESDEVRNSALIGKPAPDFELELLDGTKFRLSGHRDKIVVLDFWASWCGPCQQTMPQIDKVAREFSDRGVELIAVNLEEPKDRIQATLDRLKLKTPVALDRTGRVAEQYGAASIPQTVIIDRSGKVVRLFVGGGPKFGDQLRTALQAVLSENP